MKTRKIHVAYVIGLLLLVKFSVAQIQDLPELKNINLVKSENKLEVQLEVTEAVQYESFILSDLTRLVIDLFDVEKFSCNPVIEVNDFGVIAIRTAKNQPNVTRVVFDLDKDTPSYSIEEKEGGISIIFWLEKEEKPVQEEIKKEEIPPVPVAEEPKKEKKIEKEKIISVGFDSGFYFIQDADFQDVYGKSAPFFGGEGSFQIFFKEKESAGVSLSLNSIFGTGKTTYTKEEVKLKITPLSLSAFYMRNYGRFFPFVSLGADYIYYKESYPETFAVSSVSGSVWGFNIRLGTYVRLINSLSLKVYFKFRSARTTENDVDINLGGNEYGLGFTYHFKI